MANIRILIKPMLILERYSYYRVLISNFVRYLCLMNIENYRSFCLNLKGVTEGFPFDETTLVFKVMNKIFTITDTEDIFKIAVKCDPEMAEYRRAMYPAVKPGYHLSKKHWNTVIVDGSVSDNMLQQWILESYDLIVAGLAKKIKEELNILIRNEAKQQ